MLGVQKQILLNSILRVVACGRFQVRTHVHFFLVVICRLSYELVVDYSTECG